jgi:hypothetical protein
MSSLSGPVDSGSDKLVKPADNSLHQGYTFYIKATALGGTNKYFGPYTVNVGCFSGSFTITNSASFVTEVSKELHSATANAFTMHNPSSSRSYCSLLSNEIVKSDGTTWTAAAKLTGSGS